MTDIWQRPRSRAGGGVMLAMRPRALVVGFSLSSSVLLLLTAPLAVASAPPAYTQLMSASAAQAGAELLLSVSTKGTIPRFPDAYINSVLAFGYAWVDTSTGTGVVLVIHPSFVDSLENPTGWHTHAILLTTGTAESTFCLVSATDAQGGIVIAGSSAALGEPEMYSGVPASDLGVAAAFIAQPDSSCPASSTGLGVVVLSAESL